MSHRLPVRILTLVPPKHGTTHVHAGTQFVAHGAMCWFSTYLISKYFFTALGDFLIF